MLLLSQGFLYMDQFVFDKSFHISRTELSQVMDDPDKEKRRKNLELWDLFCWGNFALKGKNFSNLGFIIIQRKFVVLIGNKLK